MNRADECMRGCEDGNGVVLEMEISVTQFRRPLICICRTSSEPFGTCRYITSIALPALLHLMHNLKQHCVVSMT